VDLYLYPPYAINCRSAGYSFCLFVCLEILALPLEDLRGSHPPLSDLGTSGTRTAHFTLSNTVSQFWLREPRDVSQQCEGGGTETGS